MNVRNLTFALICFVSTGPFFFWEVSIYILVFMLLIYIFTTLFTKNRLKISLRELLTSIFIFFITLGFFIINGLALGAIVFSTIIFILYLIKDDNLLKIFFLFKKLVCFFIIPSVLLWFTHVLFLGNNDFLVLGQIDTVNPYKKQDNLFYYIYPFMTIVSYDFGSAFYRFSGPFDEPGVVGSLTALFLSIDKFSLSKNENKVLFIGGLISFSLVFYIIFFLYFIVNMFFNFKRSILFTLLFTVFFYWVYIKSNIGNYFYKLIFERLKYKNGDFSGNNRNSELLNIQFESWLNTTDINVLFFGEKIVNLDGSSSLKQVLISSGLFGLTGIFCVLYILGFKRYAGKLDVHLIIFVIIFFLFIYQRPDFTSIYVYVIFSAGFLILSKPKLTFNERAV